jgi:hypothetical protein
MTNDVEAFLREIEASPKFIAGVASDPKILAGFEGMVSGLRIIYAHGEDEPAMIELYDRVRRIVARHDTIKVRLLAIQDLMIRARVRQQ